MYIFTFLYNNTYIFVYIIFIKLYTLLIETTTVYFILSNRQVVTSKYIVICGKNNMLEIDNTKLIMQIIQLL